MAGPEIKKSEAEFIIDIVEDPLTNVPPNLVPGMDPDGLPRTDPGPPQPPKPKSDPKAEKKKADEAELVKALQAERDAERQARAEAEKKANALQQAAVNERRARMEAEERDARSTSVATRAHMTTLETRLDAFKQGAAQAKSHMASIRREKIAAMENADHARVAELDEQLAKATNYEATYLQGVADYEGRIEDMRGRIQAAQEEQAAAAEQQRQRQQQQQQRPPQQQQQQKQPTTPDEWIDAVTPAIGDMAAKWLRQHKEMLTERGQELRTFSDYYSARNGGPAAWKTSAFVEALNAEFYPDKEGEVEEEEVEEQAPEPKAPPPKRAPAAPVSRNAPGKSSTDNRIQLSPQEFAIAVSQWKESDWDLFDPSVKAKFPGGWSPQAARFQYDWAKQKAIKEGKYNKQG